jgi:hypothetical protein
MLIAAVVIIKPRAGHPLVQAENDEKFVFDMKSCWPYGDRLRFFTYKAASSGVPI